MSEQSFSRNPVSPPHDEPESERIGTLATSTHWLRGIKAYGGPPKAAFLVHVWWPVSDPRPQTAIWNEPAPVHREEGKR